MREITNHACKRITNHACKRITNHACKRIEEIGDRLGKVLVGDVAEADKKIERNGR